MTLAMQTELWTINLIYRNINVVCQTDSLYVRLLFLYLVVLLFLLFFRLDSTLLVISFLHVLDELIRFHRPAFYSC